MGLFDRQRTDWHFAEPRLTSGAFDLVDNLGRATRPSKLCLGGDFVHPSQTHESLCE